MTVCITGASQGIGAALARAFAAEDGARLALVARSRDTLEAVADDCERLGARASVFPCDLTDAAAQALAPVMREQEAGGSIVHVGTNLVYNPVVTYHDYTAAKAGLVGLTRTLAKELGPSGIRVNLVAGGLLQTTDASAVTTDEVFEFVRSVTPLQRTVTPEQFADAVLFFASPLSRTVTGQSLAVDGGLTMP